jgi:hypothetical protein
MRPSRKAYATPTVLTIDSTEVIEQIGPAQAYPTLTEMTIDLCIGGSRGCDVKPR